MDSYATHLPVLAAAVAAARPGPVLELGAGRYSTPLLHALCAATNRQLVTLDHDGGWVSQFADFQSDRHTIQHVPDWAAYAFPSDWAVVFVDHGPYDRRFHEIDRLRDRCELMVVHDTEDPCYGYERAFAAFAYRVDYRRLKPWTSILSATRDLVDLRDL